MFSIYYVTDNLDIEWSKNVLYSWAMSMTFRPLPAFKNRTDLHLSRKLWHCLGVLTILVVYRSVSRPVALQLIALATVVFVSLDILRLFLPGLNRQLTKLFRPFMRSHEQNALAGTTFLLLGVLTITAFFPKSIVMLSLLFLAIADPLASFVGILYGKDKILGHKSLQGTAAAFVACSLIAATYFLIFGWMTDRIIIVSLLAGVIGAASELVPIFKFDDNLTFPIVSSSLLHLLFWVFGGF